LYLVKIKEEVEEVVPMLSNEVGAFGCIAVHPSMGAFLRDELEFRESEAEVSTSKELERFWVGRHG
jgi:hypothetical protein